MGRREGTKYECDERLVEGFVYSCADRKNNGKVEKFLAGKLSGSWFFSPFDGLKPSHLPMQRNHMSKEPPYTRDNERTCPSWPLAISVTWKFHVHGTQISSAHIAQPSAQHPLC